MMPIMDDVLYASSDRWSDKQLGLVALDPLTGALQWSYYPGSDISQLAAASGLVFLRWEDSIEAVDVQTHRRRWSWDADVEIESEDGEESESDWSGDDDATAITRHFFVADGLLYVFSDPGQIIALDVQTGETQWEWQMDGAMREYWQATSPDTDEDDEEACLDPAAFCTIAGGTLYVVAGGDPVRFGLIALIARCLRYDEGRLSSRLKAGAKQRIPERCVERSRVQKYLRDKITGQKFEQKGGK